MSKYFRIAQFAERVGRATSTIRRWESEGKLVPDRLPSGQRVFTQEHIDKVLGITPKNRKTVVYSRVSSRNQKDDLENQVMALETFCSAKGLTVDEWASDIGSGLNFKRPNFLKIVEGLATGEISTLVVAHKDRLTRFGFEVLEHLAGLKKAEILVMNHETLSPQGEMVEDLMTIIHVFSCRLYGLRSYKKHIKEAAEQNAGA